ncbi:MAG: acyltransferase, partial [Dysgonamonadaceae bacterium]
RDQFQIAITPEGTRKRVKEWKRGFYFIAIKAEVPIVLIAFDYAKKTISFLDVFHPTGNVTEDVKTIRSKYNGVEAKHPEQFKKLV